MIKTAVKKILRRYCPNIPALRKALAQGKLREINRYTVPASEVHRGEASAEAQAALVAEYSERWPAHVVELNRKLDAYLSNCDRIRNRKDIETLRNKVLFACLAYGFAPDEFFAYELENKTPEQRKSYISDRELTDFIYRSNDIIDIDVFLDKYKTYRRYKEYFRREAVCVEKQADYDRFQRFVKAHPVYVKKNVMLSKGDSVELVDLTNAGDDMIRRSFESFRFPGKYILEERIQQSRFMSQLSLQSVNTVRVITFGNGQEIEVGPCFLKIGRGQSFVDNAGKGGILIGIDSDTGILDTNGFNEYADEFEFHPDTKIAFKGLQLPDWPALRALAQKLSAMTPTVRYIGWDFAHTEEGWVVVEGNGCSQMICPQIAWKRGFKEDLVRYQKKMNFQTR